jgi:hypothetical protein
MSTHVLFNQLAYIDRLVRGGFSPDQARASAEALESAFTETVATKFDLEREVASVKAEISTLEARLKLEIAHAKNDTLRWVFGFNLVLVGAIFTIVKFVH